MLKRRDVENDAGDDDVRTIVQSQICVTATLSAEESYA
jgi:hypothetical protein